MQGDARVVEYLNRSLRHELTAINQYWLHYRLLDNWGYRDLAKKWRKESIEEMEHADKIVERIIFLDGFPNMQVLDPLHIGQNVREVLDCDLAAEMSARALYQEAATHCHSVKDYVTRDLFEKLMHDEEAAHRFSRDPARSRRQARPRALCAAPHRQDRRRSQLIDPGIGALPGVWARRLTPAFSCRGIRASAGRGAGPLDEAWLLPYVRRRDTPPHRGATIWKDRP